MNVAYMIVSIVLTVAGAGAMINSWGLPASSEKLEALIAGYGCLILAGQASDRVKQEKP